MKWLNKSVSCLLAVGLLLGFSGCGGRTQAPGSSTPSSSLPDASITAPLPPEAHVLYQTALEKMTAANGLAGSLKMELTTSVAGITANIPIEAQLEVAEKEGAALMHALVTTSMLGQPLQMEMWQDKDYQYTSALGQKTKEPLSQEDEEDILPTEELDKLAESLRENAYVTPEENGYAIAARLPGGQMSAILKTLLDLTGEDGLDQADNVAYSDIELNIAVDEDTILRRMSLEGEVTGRVSQPDIGDPSKTVEIEALYQYHIVFTVDKLGEEVTVTMPEDPDSFTEIPANLDEVIVAEVVETLFDANGQPVENFGDIYEQLVRKYGAEKVDQVLAALLADPV